MSLSVALSPALSLLLLFSTISVFIPEQNILADADSTIYRDGCRFNNMSSWTYFHEYIYNQQLIIYFDYEQNKFIGLYDWMKTTEDKWNKELAPGMHDEGIRICDNNIPIDTEVLTRRVKPTVTIRPEETAHTGHLLTCYVMDFYPEEIKVTWRRNGQAVSADKVSTTRMTNGDWTYQVHKVLQYDPASGDQYSCHVQHQSLDSDIDHPWVPEGMPESERIRIVVGGLGFAFGFILLLAGVIMRLRNAKAILDASGSGPRLMGASVS